MATGAVTHWNLSRWLASVRFVQALAALVTASSNAFLLVYIHNNRLGLTDTMIALELMACATLIYPGLVLLIQHTGRRRQQKSTGLIAIFVCTDILLNGLMIAIITVLAHSGVPSNCRGLTRDNVLTAEPSNDPSQRFEKQPRPVSGLLGSYCGIARGFYFISVALVFTYMLTITLGVLRMCEGHYTKNSRVDLLLATGDHIHHLDRIRSKVHRQESLGDSQNQDSLARGIMGPPSHHSSTVPPRSIDGVAPTPVSPTIAHHTSHGRLPTTPSPVPPVSPLTPGTPSHSFAPIPAAYDTPTGGLTTGHEGHPAAEATVADGYRHEPENHRASYAAAEAAVADGYQHQMQNGFPSLPPYSPGPSRGFFMEGHGDESNEMRLSDYVKGGTRAQTMKDDGGGL
ncbi:hypothetical protein F5Y15DRAFT_27818 [Xylariaceae sp. FL0016]|nr:hypothetical protein F5Y15DRAFT_27818 [Xylariaceae sp. FL0016]